MSTDVVIVSGVRLYADGLSRALAEDERIVVRDTVATHAALLGVLAVAAPDVVVLDLAGLDDLDELRAMVSASPRIRFVALAVRARDTEVIGWAEAGVAGMVTRDASLEEFKDVVVGAAQDQAPCSPRVSAALLRRVAAAAREHPRDGDLPALTARERQVAELLAQGLSNKEIAARLFLGVSTVKNHVHNLLVKLEASSRTAAAERVQRASVSAELERELHERLHGQRARPRP